MKFRQIDKRGAISGLNILSGVNSSAYGVGFIKLKVQNERVPRMSIDKVVAAINNKMTAVKDAQVFIFQPPTVQGFGNTSGFEVIDSGQEWRTAGQTQPGNQWFY